MPSLKRLPQPAPQAPAPGAKVVPPVQIASGRLLALGIVVFILAVDALLVPGYLVLKSTPVAAAGVLLAALGALAMYAGSRKPKSD